MEDSKSASGLREYMQNHFEMAKKEKVEQSAPAEAVITDANPIKCTGEATPSDSKSSIGFSSLQEYMQNHFETVKEKDAQSPHSTFMMNPDARLATTSEEKRMVQRLLISYIPAKYETDPELEKFESKYKTDPELENMCQAKENEHAKDHISEDFHKLHLTVVEAVDSDSDDEIDLTPCIIKPEDRFPIHPPQPMETEPPEEESVFESPEPVVESKPLVEYGPHLPCAGLHFEYFQNQRKEFRKKYKLIQKRMSSFAKALCYEPEISVPQIELRYQDPQNTVKRFKFDTPSPDEIALEALRKRGNEPVRKFFFPQP